MTRGLAAMQLLRHLLLAAALAFAAGGALSAQPPKQGPGWGELTAEQRQVLAPLEKSWDELDASRKKKWIGVARRYPTMTPTGQTRVQRRMEAWAKLTPDQRRQARENYRNISKLPPEKKQDLKQQWIEYQSLSPTERRKLQAPPAEAKPAERKRRVKPPAQNTAPSPQTQPSMP
jgi:hypothetical protein